HDLGLQAAAADRGGGADPVEGRPVVGVDAVLALARPARPRVFHRRVQHRTVRLSPAGAPSGARILASNRVSARSVCALPSNPPQGAATASSAASPLCPYGGWPRSWARPAASTTSGSQPRAAPSSRPT